MRFIKNLLAGMLLTGVLVLASPNSFARGGGGAVVNTLEVAAMLEGFTAGLAAANRGCGAWIPADKLAQGGRGDGVLHHDGGWSRHSYPGYYRYFGPFDYGLDDYSGPYYDYNATGQCVRDFPITLGKLLVPTHALERATADNISRVRAVIGEAAIVAKADAAFQNSPWDMA